MLMAIFFCFHRYFSLLMQRAGTNTAMHADAAAERVRVFYFLFTRLSRPARRRSPIPEIIPRRRAAPALLFRILRDGIIWRR